MNSRKMARNAILEVVNNQIRDLTPPETKETFDRLITEGLSPADARRLIGCAVVSEIFDILKHNEPYDEERYIKALRKLPELPEKPSEPTLRATIRQQSISCGLRGRLNNRTRSSQ